MIVNKSTIQGILDGKITQVRLPARPNRYGFTPKQVDSLRAALHHRDGDGHVQKVTAGSTRWRIRILKYEQVQLDDVTDDQARAEGYPNAEALMNAFLETYQTSWTDTQGWLVTIKPDIREEVRLLARQHGARFEDGPDLEDAGQYTTSGPRAIPNEPEAVDPKLVEKGATALEARQRWQRAKLQEQKRLADLPISHLVERELAEARAAKMDTTRYEQRLLSTVLAMRRRREIEGL